MEDIQFYFNFKLFFFFFCKWFLRRLFKVLTKFTSQKTQKGFIILLQSYGLLLCAGNSIKPCLDVWSAW